MVGCCGGVGEGGVVSLPQVKTQQEQEEQEEKERVMINRSGPQQSESPSGTTPIFYTLNVASMTQGNGLWLVT